MQKIKQYSTIKGFSEFIYKEKGSEFIAQAYPVDDEEAFQNILSEIKKKHYDASHHCYAVKMINDFIRYSDDGEPNATAGVRILNAIDHHNLNNVAVIVVRYFGGTKLGVGPLGKAYYTAADEVLSMGEKVINKAFIKIFVEGSFSSVSQIHRLFALYKVRITNTEYNEAVKFECLAEPEILEKLQNQLTEVSSGEISVKKPDETFLYKAIE